MALTLLFGGARSGKSAIAVALGKRHGRAVTYIATAPAVDDDMTARIEWHRAERPASWSTTEEPLDLAGAIAAAPNTSVSISTPAATQSVSIGASPTQMSHLAA